MQDNQIESIIKDCQITSSSQEESPSSPVQVTGIIMVSPPESNAEEEEEEEEEEGEGEEVFHTPPDINRLPSSDDAVPEIRPDNPQVDPKSVVEGGSGDAVMSVDLGKDSVTLGFSEPNSILYGDDDCVKKHVICLEANGSKVELDSKNMSEVVESEFDHRSENLRHNENVESENGREMEAKVSEEDTEMEAKVSEEDTEFVDKQMVTYTNPGGHIFRSGDTREGVLARRRPGLPNSNVRGGAIVPWLSLDDRDTVNDLFNAAGILFDDTTDDTDFLEAAMECGITFHRPRWWPE